MGHKKPTGRVGSAGVTNTEQGLQSHWTYIEFPEKKSEIEDKIVEIFRQKMEETGAKFNSVEQNEENNFDYTLSLPGGRVYMDLAEIVYHDGKGSPYAGGDVWIEPIEHCQAIEKIILKKSEKYQSKESSPIHLLLYNTHYKFALADQTAFLAKHRLKSIAHRFENIFFLSLMADDLAVLDVLHPTLGRYSDKKVAEQAAAARYLLFDVANCVIR